MYTTDCIYNHYLIVFLIYGAVSVSKYIILHINIHCTILLNSTILNSNCTKIIHHRPHLFLYMQILNYMYTKLLFLWVPNVRLFTPTWSFIRKLAIFKKQH